MLGVFFCRGGMFMLFVKWNWCIYLLTTKSRFMGRGGIVVDIVDVAIN
jgi:hypothetical protein